MTSEPSTNFKELLDATHVWPCDYLFKFIIEKTFIDDARKFFEKMFEECEITLKESSKGKYLSLSIKTKMNSSDEVLAVYAKAKDIKSLITL